MISDDLKHKRTIDELELKLKAHVSTNDALFLHCQSYQFVLNNCFSYYANQERSSEEYWTYCAENNNESELSKLFENYLSSNPSLYNIDQMPCLLCIAKIMIKPKQLYYIFLVPTKHKQIAVCFFQNSSLSDQKKDIIRKQLFRNVDKNNPDIVSEMQIIKENKAENLEITLVKPHFFSFQEENRLDVCQEIWDKSLGFDIVLQPFSNKKRKILVDSPVELPVYMEDLLHKSTVSNERTIVRKRTTSKNKNKFPVLHTKNNKIKPLNVLPNVLKDSTINELSIFKDKIFQNTICMNTIAKILKKDEKDYYRKMMFNEDDVFFGALASKFFESVGWRSSGFEEIKEKIINQLNVDTDQVVLVLKNPAISTSFINPDVNKNCFLNKICNDLKTNLYKNVLDHSKVKLNKTDFLKKCNKKPGHTYMDDKERKNYNNILNDFTVGVFKISVNLVKNSENIGEVDVKEYIWSIIVEVATWYIIEHEKKIFWTKKQIEDILSGNDSNTVLYITGGALFPLIICLFLIHFTDKKVFQAIDIAIEAYGIKDFYNKNIYLNGNIEKDFYYKNINLNGNIETDSQTNQIENNDFEYKKLEQKNCNIINAGKISKEFFLKESENLNPLLIIKKFLCYCKNDLQIKKEQIQFIVGLGATVSTKDSLNQPCYTTINPIMKKNKDNKYDFSSDSYPIFGKLIPLDMQPTTINRKNINTPIEVHDCECTNIFRLQIYSASGRHIVGEYLPLNGERESTKIAQWNRYVNDKGYAKITEYVNESKIYMSKKLDELYMFNEENGNVARIEIAFDIDIDDIDDNITNGFTTLISICMHHTKSYSYEDFFIVFRFLLLGYFYRINSMREMIETDPYYDSRYFEMIDIVTFHSGAMNSLWSGKYIFNDGRSYLPKTAFNNNRPIFPKLPPNMYRKREEKLTNYFNRSNGADTSLLCFVQNDSQNNEIPKIEERNYIFEIPNIMLNSHVLHSKQYKINHAMFCTKCYTIFMNIKQINAFLAHPCIVNKIDITQKKNVNSETFRTFHNKNFNNLSNDQKLIYEDFFGDRRHRNFLLMGVAGSGKSFTVNVIMEKILLEKGRTSCASVAWTKQGASQVHGETICSFFMISGTDVDELVNATEERTNNILTKTFQEITKSSDRIDIMLQLHHFIIDECSMISASLLSFIDKMFKRILNCATKPFGGIQVILVGDVLQSPPIAKNQKSCYFFESSSYYKSNFSVAYLSEIFRQKDPSFTNLLNKIRIGEIEQSDLDEINKNWGNNLNRDFIRKLFQVCKSIVNEELLNDPNPNKIYKYIGNKVYQYNSVRGSGMISDEVKNKIQPHLLRYKPPPPLVTYETECNKLIELQLKKLEIDKSDPTMNDCFIPPIIIGIENIETRYFNQQIFEYLYGNKKFDLIKTIDSINPIPKSEFEFNLLKGYLNNESNLESELKLIIGMPVIFVSNTVDDFVANNQLGIILNITETYIEVQPIFNNNKLIKTVKVKKETFVVDKNINNRNFKLTRQQYPLKPGFASTLYTLQGCTIPSPKKAIFNNQRIQKDSTAAAYTAMSRVQNKDDILTLFPLSLTDIVVDKKAKKFDEFHRLSNRLIYDVNYDIVNGEIIEKSTFDIITSETECSPYLLVPTSSHQVVIANMNGKTSVID